MDEDFRRLTEDFKIGKKLLVEGLSGYMEIFRMYLKIAQGMKKLGIADFFELSAANDDPTQEAEIWELTINSFLNSLKEAKTREEIERAIQEHRDFLKRFF